MTIRPMNAEGLVQECYRLVCYYCKLGDSLPMAKDRALGVLGVPEELQDRITDGVFELIKSDEPVRKNTVVSITTKKRAVIYIDRMSLAAGTREDED